GLGFLEAILGDVDGKPVGDDVAGAGVFEAIEEYADDAKARGHDAARVAGVDAFAEDLDREIADDRAAKRRGHPELVVVSAAAIKTNYQTWSSDPIREELDVRRKVDRAALLAALDDHDDARVRRLLILQRADRGDRGKDRVAVVRAAASVKPPVAEHR